MKIAKRILIGLVVVLLLVISSIYLFLQTTKPTYSGEMKLEGLTAEVEVLYDDYGVPHIYAQNEEDAYFALGYVHAQDRLFQMEMIRRAASGRLSEILGDKFITTDKLFRTLGLNQFAKEHAQKFLSTDTAAYQKDVFAYQKGVNQFIKTGKTPLEFSIIGIPKEEFTPEDIYLAIGYLSFGFADGLKTDPVLQKIKTEYGAEHLKDLDLETSSDAILVPNYDVMNEAAKLDNLISSIDESLSKLPVPLLQGSNGWVISADKSTTGFPILANDTHIGFSQPAVWYEAHIEYPGFRFYGHHMAGIPFGVLGNNEFCGWGLTMFKNDDIDFFTETVNPENPKQVKFKEQWEELKSRKEIIHVKEKEDVLIEVRSSRHGPIINGALENTSEKSSPVAMSWILTQVPNQAMDALYRLNHASTFGEAQYGASLISAPGLNIMYGDVDKNIAWWAVAKLPIRPKHVASKLFLDGASGNDEYLGFYDFSKNPHAINPPWGYLYSTNNQPDSVEGVLYPGYYYQKGRAGRVLELLTQDRMWSPDDMKNINLDVMSKNHTVLAKEIAGVLKSLDKPVYSSIVQQLEMWDGNHKQTDTAPSVYYNMLSQIMYQAMSDEIGAQATKTILGTSISKTFINTFVLNDSTPWWDDTRTKEIKETRAAIFEKSAIRTIQLLTETCGSNPESWRWGKIHTLTHTHPLAAVKPLDKFFNVGPFAVDGGSEVINNLSFSLDTTGYFPVTSGPALRKVTDFSTVEVGETISPSGQSGNVMSSHYGDQGEMFATGKTRKMLMNRKEIEAKSNIKLVLKP
jgi:penicillin G amidase